jgi:hypothetical protein
MSPKHKNVTSPKNTVLVGTRTDTSPPPADSGIGEDRLTGNPISRSLRDGSAQWASPGKVFLGSFSVILTVSFYLFSESKQF